MDIREILEYLPHRYPMLLVDRVLECEPGKRLLALKNVTMNELFFTGHFPHYPVMPGVMIIEALAQAAAVLSFRTMNTKPDDKSVYYFAGIDEARFKRPVVPGGQLLLEVAVERSARGLGKFSGEAPASGASAATTGSWPTCISRMTARSATTRSLQMRRHLPVTFTSETMPCWAGSPEPISSSRSARTRSPGSRRSCCRICLRTSWRRAIRRSLSESTARG